MQLTLSDGSNIILMLGPRLSPDNRVHISSPEHEVLMVSYCGQSMSVMRRPASTIALKAYSSYTPGPIDSILGRKHRGDLQIKNS